jgi:hypothetical protein
MGMERSCVILDSAGTQMQLKNLAVHSGIDKFERYLNSVDMPNWKTVAEAWVLRGVDPDKK